MIEDSASEGASFSMVKAFTSLTRRDFVRAGAVAAAAVGAGLAMPPESASALAGVDDTLALGTLLVFFLAVMCGVTVSSEVSAVDLWGSFDSWLSTAEGAVWSGVQSSFADLVSASSWVGQMARLPLSLLGKDVVGAVRDFARTLLSGGNEGASIAGAVVAGTVLTQAALELALDGPAPSSQGWWRDGMVLSGVFPRSGFRRGYALFSLPLTIGSETLPAVYVSGSVVNGVFVPERFRGFNNGSFSLDLSHSGESSSALLNVHPNRAYASFSASNWAYDDIVFSDSVSSGWMLSQCWLVCLDNSRIISSNVLPAAAVLGAVSLVSGDVWGAPSLGDTHIGLDVLGGEAGTQFGDFPDVLGGAESLGVLGVDALIDAAGTLTGMGDMLWSPSIDSVLSGAGTWADVLDLTQTGVGALEAAQEALSALSQVYVRTAAGVEAMTAADALEAGAGTSVSPDSSGSSSGDWGSSTVPWALVWPFNIPWTLLDALKSHSVGASFPDSFSVPFPFSSGLTIDTAWLKDLREMLRPVQRLAYVLGIGWAGRRLVNPTSDDGGDS